MNDKEMGNKNAQDNDMSAYLPIGMIFIVLGITTNFVFFFIGMAFFILSLSGQNFFNPSGRNEKGTTESSKEQNVDMENSETDSQKVNQEPVNLLKTDSTKDDSQQKD